MRGMVTCVHDDTIEMGLSDMSGLSSGPFGVVSQRTEKALLSSGAMVGWMYQKLIHDS